MRSVGGSRIASRAFPFCVDVCSVRDYFKGGPYLWIDDEAFDIADHVGEVKLSPPAGDAELLKAAERLMGRLLDRSRPL